MLRGAEEPLVRLRAPCRYSEPAKEVAFQVRHQVVDLDMLEAATLARPRTRGDCREGPRPCPWLLCRYHLFLDLSRAGGILYNWPTLSLEAMPETCALDVAERGGASLEQVGSLLGLTRERVRQIEGKALRKMRDGTVDQVGLGS